MTIFLFILGFVALIGGAQWLIDGASVLAKKLGVPKLIVGLTVVAFGTSLPELIVNLFANSESGSADLAIGNILGSNIANILLILGATAIIHPLSVRRRTVYREILFNIMASCMLALLVSERLLSEGGFSGLDKIDGVVLMSYFIIFMYFTFGHTIIARREQAEKYEQEEGQEKHTSAATIFLQIAAGIAGLALGGRWIVDGAIFIAETFGLSDALIGLTVVAIGTSLPELATSIVAALRKDVDIAVGNVVGSNLFNIFWVLGLSAFLSPLPFSDELLFDVGAVIATSLLLFGTMIFGKYKHQINKREGYIFLAFYAAYLLANIYYATIG